MSCMWWQSRLSFLPLPSCSTLLRFPVAIQHIKLQMTWAHSWVGSKDEFRLTSSSMTSIAPKRIGFHFIYIFTAFIYMKIHEWASEETKLSRLSNEAEGRMLNVNSHLACNSIYRLNNFLKDEKMLWHRRWGGGSFKWNLWCLQTM